jgi:hypothetical protein
LSRDVFLLNRGFHPIIIRCRVLQPGIVRFFWKPKANDIQKDTSASFYTLPISVGLMGRYYNNIDWVGEPKLQQIDPFLYFHWERDTLDPLPGTFSVEWRGVLHVAKAGVYVFDIFSCGNSSLQIDNQVVINSDGFHWLEYREGNINLVEGEHDITIRHAFKQGPRVLEVHWAPPGEQKEIISAWLLTPL